MSDSEWLKKSLDKVDEKVDHLHAKIDTMQTIHQTNSESLVKHIARTDYLQEEVHLLRNQIKPIEKHVYYVQGGFKVLGVIVTALGIIVGVLKIITNLL